MDRKKLASILADFTDLLNEHGPKSQEVQALRTKYEGDKDLMKLFDTVLKVQAQFKEGKLKLPEDEGTRTVVRA